MANLEREVANLQGHVDTLKSKVESLSAGRKETEERQANMAEYTAAMQLKAEQLRELQQHADNDPEKIELLQKAIKQCREGTNRWVDNIYSIKVGGWVGGWVGGCVVLLFFFSPILPPTYPPHERATW